MTLSLAWQKATRAPERATIVKTTLQPAPRLSVPFVAVEGFAWVRPKWEYVGLSVPYHVNNFCRTTCKFQASTRSPPSAPPRSSTSSSTSIQLFLSLQPLVILPKPIDAMAEQLILKGTLEGHVRLQNYLLLSWLVMAWNEGIVPRHEMLTLVTEWLGHQLGYLHGEVRFALALRNLRFDNMRWLNGRFGWVW